MVKNQNKAQRIVIVGGGFAGCKAALELANKKNFEVTLISSSPHFEYHGALYRSATGYSPMEVVIPIKDILKRAKNVTFILDTIERIDSKKNCVISIDGNLYDYDNVIFAMGNVVNYFGIDGMEKYSLSMNSISHTIAIRNQLTTLFKQSGSSPTVAIVGAGASGVELAGEVEHFAKLVANRYGIESVKPKVVLIEGADRVLPMLDAKLSEKAAERLKKLGIDLRLNTRVNSCEAGKVCLDSGDLLADCIVWTAGSRAPDFYAKHSKVFTIERGRAKVDDYLRAYGQDNIYVLGDNANTKFSGMAQTALHDAKFVTRNFTREVNNQPLAQYKAYHPIYVIPVGHKWAVLQTQNKKWSGYKAWLVRRKADKQIFENFLPYKQAIKTWRKANRLARF